MATICHGNHLSRNFHCDINFVLVGNQIGEQGMAAILKAMQYQTTLSLGSKSGGTGLMRICVFVSSYNCVLVESYINHFNWIICLKIMFSLFLSWIRIFLIKRHS